MTGHFRCFAEPPPVRAFEAFDNQSVDRWITIHVTCILCSRICHKQEIMGCVCVAELQRGEELTRSEVLMQVYFSATMWK